MKRSIQLLLTTLLLLGLPFLLISQSADEIIAKHIKAHGGAENWEKVEALELNGTFTSFSIEKPFRAFKTNTGMYYADLFLGEIGVVEAFDGSKGWTIDPWQDIFHARKLNVTEQNVFQQKAEYFTPFYKYKEKGYEVEFLGNENIDGMELLALKLTRSNGKIETWYLDPDTYLEYHCASEWVDFAWPSPAETFFDDFREVDGLIIPFFTDRTFMQRNRILQLEEVIVNPEIDMELFDMPRKTEMEKLAFLEGDWNVNIEVMTGRGSWYPIGSYPSTFHFESPNLLVENISYERIFPIKRTLSFTYHEASKKYRIGAFNDLTVEMELLEGTLTDTTFLFDNLGIKYDAIENPQYAKVEIKKQENGGFILTVNTTPDGGETWQPVDRFTYIRKEE